MFADTLILKASVSFQTMNIYRHHIALGFLALLILVWPVTIQAHIETNMPDPIAEIEYQMVLDFEPEDSTTRYKLAMVYYRLKKDAKAEKELQKVLDATPLFFHALEGLGMLRLRQERFPEAVTLLDKAVQQKGHESGTYFYLGQAKLGLKDHAGAQIAFATGLEECLSEELSKRAIPIEQFQEALAKTDQ